MKPIFIFFRFVLFYFRATTRYRVHSPFVFDFIQNVLEDDRNYYIFPKLEKLRRQLLNNKNRIDVTDFGAGSQVIKSRQRQINQMAKSSLTPPSYCQLLFRLIIHYQPQYLLELGTSFGISTLYQGMTGTKSQVISIEGCEKVANIARNHFQLLGAKNIQLINGPFDKMLPQALKQLEKLDYVFIDGNHRLAPTLLYFEQCLEYAHDDSIFIFHDIHWTTEMEQAWKKIQDHPKVRLTIDLFFMGIVFFRSAQKEKEHFMLVPSHWKPWIRGFWTS